jgi:hypothetical protein
VNLCRSSYCAISCSSSVAQFTGAKPVIFLSAQELDLSCDFSFLLEIQSVSQSICTGGFFLFSAQNTVLGSRVLLPPLIFFGGHVHPAPSCIASLCVCVSVGLQRLVLFVTFGVACAARSPVVGSDSSAGSLP